MTIYFIKCNINIGGKMKKILICIFSIILFTGCGSTKLKCEKYEKKAGYDYSESY